MNWEHDDIQKVAKALAARLYPRVRREYSIDDILQEFYLGYRKSYSAWDQVNTGAGALIVLFRTQCNWISSTLSQKATRNQSVLFSTLGESGTQHIAETLEGCEDDPAMVAAAEDILAAARGPVRRAAEAFLEGKYPEGQRHGRYKWAASYTGRSYADIASGLDKLKQELSS